MLIAMKNDDDKHKSVRTQVLRKPRVRGNTSGNVTKFCANCKDASPGEAPNTREHPRHKSPRFAALLHIAIERSELR
eukprot:698493-Pyramimonas_sp.AAC.1